MNLLQVFLFVLFIAYVHGDCIWYDICKVGNRNYYCHYNGTAKLLDDKALNVLQTWCPTYADKQPVKLCCSANQLAFVSSSLKQAYQFLRRCPACLANFKQLFCSMTCDPDQANFLTPTVISNFVQSVSFSVTTNVANSLYDNCKDVKFGSSLFIDTLCQTSKCNPTLLLQALGKSVDNGGQSPFQINFNIVDDPTKHPMDMPVFKCNESVPRRHLDSGGPACSCVDCNSSCPVPPTIPPEVKPTKIFGINLWSVVGFLVFVALSLVFITYVITQAVYKVETVNIFNVINKDQCDCCTQHRNYHRQKLMEEQSAKLPNAFVKLNVYINTRLSNSFSWFGLKVARSPIIVLIVSFALIAILSCGLFIIKITTNPVELWSSPTSRSRLEKNYFDNNFAPFYRVEQLIIRPRNQNNFTHKKVDGFSGDALFGAAFRKDFLLDVLKLQQAIEQITAGFESNKTYLRDICFKPLAPDNENCAITGPWGYFQNNVTLFNKTVVDEFGFERGDYLNHIFYCISSPLLISGSPLDANAGCLSPSGIPMAPGLVFGSFNQSFYNGSTSVVITILVNNHPDPKSTTVRRAEAWEAVYIDLVKRWQIDHPQLSISFQAERSVEDEISRQSNSDVFTVAISYLVMFVYVSLFLGSYRSCKTTFIDIRITLGLGGIVIVLASVLASVGFWSFVQFPVTLIIVEVIPFLVLAVGVDNIFILVHEFEHECRHADQWALEHRASRLGNDNDLVQQDDSNEISWTKEMIVELVELTISNSLGRVGPSILLTALAESVAFFCGALTSMPAVRLFALYAGMAIVFNFLLQIFAFVALLTLDARRFLANRFDVVCCFGLEHRATSTTNLIDNSASDLTKERLESRSNANVATHSHADADSLSLNPTAMDSFKNDDGAPRANMRSSVYDDEEELLVTNWFDLFVSKCLVPIVLSNWVRPIILIGSLAWICFAVSLLPNGLHIGMDQKLSMPTDSYMLDYFEALGNDLRVGPPLYFVVSTNHNYLSAQGQNRICGSGGCASNSLLNQINQMALVPSYSWISNGATSWLDDYFDWIDPQGSPLCCRVDSRTQQFCPTSVNSSYCVSCNPTLDNGRPNARDFMHYLPFFLSQNPGPTCGKANMFLPEALHSNPIPFSSGFVTGYGGKAAYSVGVRLSPNNQTVNSSYFLTYHSVLKKPDDFVNALKASRRLAQNISNLWHVNQSKLTYKGQIEPDIVFPYSVFYVFYEQYLTVANEAVLQLGICLGALAFVTLIFFGLNLVATLMIIFGVLYIMLSVSGIMVLWSISLNALSLVNLVVTLGISVEFCAHIVRSFTLSAKWTRVERSKEALSSMGGSILRGITLTKLGGIIVLATSKSRLFQIFYFRMYLTMILFGALTGLIVLPVFMSYFGPSLNMEMVRLKKKSRSNNYMNFVS